MKGRDHVEYLKALDANNVGIPTLLIHSPHKVLPRLAVAWSTVAKRLTNPGLVQEIPEGIPQTELTRYLWACIEPEPEALWAEAAGLPDAAHVRRGMMTLLDNHAIFVDGTVSTWVTRYLKTENERFGMKVEEASVE